MENLCNTKIMSEIIDISGNKKEELNKDIINDLISIFKIKTEEMDKSIKGETVTEKVNTDLNFTYANKENIMITPPVMKTATISFNTANLGMNLKALSKISKYAFDKDLSWIDENKNDEDLTKINNMISNGIKKTIQDAIDYIEKSNDSISTEFKNSLIKALLGKNNGSEKYQITPIRIIKLEVLPENAMFTDTFKEVVKTKKEMEEDGIPVINNIPLLSAGTIQKYIKMAQKNNTDFRSEILKNKDCDSQLLYLKDVIIEREYDDNFIMDMWVDFSFKI